MMRDRTSRGRGFTIIELMFSLLVISIVVTIVMTVYSRSNKYAAKGNWRVQTTAKQRLALRQVKDFLDKSSYPSVIRVGNYVEASPDFQVQDYVMVLGNGTPAGSTGTTTGTSSGVTYYSFNQPGDVLTFYACTPREELEGISSAVTAIPGTANKIVLTLSAQPAGMTSGAMQLAMTTSTADVTLNGTAVQVGGFSSPPTVIPLLNDVSELIVGVPSDATQKEKTVLELTVVNIDPFDGRLAIRETAKAVINVRIKT